MASACQMRSLAQHFDRIIGSIERSLGLTVQTRTSNDRT